MLPFFLCVEQAQSRRQQSLMWLQSHPSLALPLRRRIETPSCKHGCACTPTLPPEHMT